MEENNSGLTLERSIDITKVGLLLLRRWYVIVLFIIISLVVTFIQLRYTKPLYSASVMLKFDDEKGGQVSDIFRYGRLTGRLENQLKTESEILQSRTLALSTLELLNYDVIYLQRGQIVTSEIYPFNYFKVIPLYIDSSDFGKRFIIKFTNKNTYSVKFNEKSKENFFKVNDSLVLGSSIFQVIVPNENWLSPVLNKDIEVKLHNRFYDAMRLASKIKVEVEKGTSLLKITYIDEVPQKASDFVNATAKAYMKESVNTRAKAAEQTVQFIDDLINDLSAQVESAQKSLTDFQTKNHGVEPSLVGRAQFEKLTDLEAQKSVIALKQKQLEKLIVDLKSSNNKPLQFVMLDNEDEQTIPNMIDLLNGLILERISLSSRYQINSPVMKENEVKIAELKLGINRALASLKTKLADKQLHVQGLINDAKLLLSGLPEKEQALLDLQRTFKVNEKIYGYLMEKKLETRISKSSIIANASIVDEAAIPSSPFSPKPEQAYGLSALIGLLLGVGFIFLMRIIYNRIPDKETIEGLSRVPVIGVVKKLDDEEMEDQYELYVMKSPKSVFSESIRGIRTALNFILKGETKKAICVTSSVSGEGKTFCTVNLAASLTLLGYRVVVVGCDLRRPRVHLTFRNLTNDIGITTYLIGKSSLEEIVLPSEFENLDVIPAGPTPPNPSELLQSTVMDNLIVELKERYDYVFFDTAPVGLVSDSFELMAKSDVNLFIIRANYSKRDFALIPDRLMQDNAIRNVYTVLNSFDASSSVYSSIYKTAYGGYYGGGGYYYYGGYYAMSSGYGYYNRKYYSQYYNGYYTEERSKLKPWYKRLLSVNKRRKSTKQPY
ncbi:MAG: polysaccharide biosynthesis tyrosine autokinase [Bacteroidia bacterium]|jgi:capsular exopolysaccharide synthesis family protein|nr:polysaccharide biosynthesis tyrosine autokinase [Bacteroidia bacterium]